MIFRRNFSDQAIEQLKKERLFLEYLWHDIRDSGKTRLVFPAVRQGRLDFYWAGGRLFSYNPTRGFETHIKYASVLVSDKKANIFEKELKNDARLIHDFCEGYDRIKENCQKYSGMEALGVSALYERFSCAKEKNSSVVILDIEASFASEDASRTQDRLDIVSFDTKSRKLRFFEAKHYSNRTGITNVIGQLDRYGKQIYTQREAVMNAYKNQVSVINKLFGTELPDPEIIDPEVKLLIFGFDNEQKEYLKNHILPKLDEHKDRTYFIGNIKAKKLTLETVFKGGRLQWQ